MITKITRAESYKKIRSGSRKRKIIELLRNYPDGLTVSQMQDKLGFPDRNYVAPRVTELFDADIIIETGGMRYNKETRRHEAIFALNKEVNFDGI